MVTVTRGKPWFSRIYAQADDRNMLVKLGAKMDKSTISKRVQEPKSIEKVLQPMLRNLEHANPTS